MNVEEIHKNLHKALIEDEKYQQIMKSIADKEEKKQLSEFMERFMNYFQEKVFNPLSEKIDNDQEFKDALYKKMDSLIPNKGKE